VAQPESVGYYACAREHVLGFWDRPSDVSLRRALFQVHLWCGLIMGRTDASGHVAIPPSIVMARGWSVQST
jgi:hypothetical protein